MHLDPSFAPSGSVDENWSVSLQDLAITSAFETTSEHGPAISSQGFPFHGCHNATEKLFSTTHYYPFFLRPTPLEPR